MRFFVRKSAIALMESAGLSVRGGIYTGFRRRIWNLTLRAVSFGLLNNRLAKQIILVGEKTPSVTRQRISWRVY